MPKVSVPALCDFTLKDGRSFVRGQMLHIEPIEAAILSRQRLVSLTKRTYTTREMTATAPEPEPEPEPEAPRRKRRYRRRDMQAENE